MGNHTATRVRGRGTSGVAKAGVAKAGGTNERAPAPLLHTSYRVRQDSQGYYRVEGQLAATGAWHAVGKAHATQAAAERALKTRATKDAKASGGQRPETHPAKVPEVATFARHRGVPTPPTPAAPTATKKPARSPRGTGTSGGKTTSRAARIRQETPRPAAPTRQRPTEAFFQRRDAALQRASEIEREVRGLLAERRTTQDPAARARIAARINALEREWQAARGTAVATFAPVSATTTATTAAAPASRSRRKSR